MIDKMNVHYSFTNPASVHDEEALTALELAGRQGAKINAVIDDQNKLRTETENHLKNQDSKIEIHKDVVIPQTVTSEVQKQINNGTFANAIDEYAGGLEARVDNLLGSMKEGSTTMDAEIIDARVDNDGNTWANAGKNIRSHQKKVETFLNTMTTPIVEKVEKPLSAGYYQPDGYFQTADYYRGFSVDVSAGDVFLLYAVYGYSCCGALCTDENGNVVKVFFHNESKPLTEKFTTPIVIPENATKLLVSSSITSSTENYGGLTPILMKVSGYDANLGSLKEYFDNILATINRGDEVYVDAGTSALGMLGADGRPMTTTASSYSVITVNVECGETYHIKGNAHMNKMTYALYNSGDFPVILGMCVTGESVQSDETIITIPVGVKKMRVAGISYVGSFVRKLVERQSANEHKWNHLKWCCVGDSLTELNIRTDKHYFDYVQEKTGIQVVNMGVSGTGYKNGESSDNAFYQRIVNVPEGCDVVTIFGSGNDGSSGEIGTPTDTGTTTICGCVNTTLDKLYEKHPTIQVGIVSPTPWGWQTPDDPECFMYKYSNALKSICEIRGIPFLDLFRLSGFRTMKNGVINSETHDLLFSKDPVGNNTHPNELGHKIISGHFYHFLTSLIGTY